MELKVTVDDSSIRDLENGQVTMDLLKFRKMALLYNAVEQGWSVKKRSDSYVFLKNHGGKKEVMEESYMVRFLKHNLDVSTLFVKS